MTEGHVTFTVRNGPSTMEMRYKQVSLFQSISFVGYVKICSSPETFYFWIFEPPKKGNFGLTLSKQTNEQTQIHAQSVSGFPGNPVLKRQH